MSRPQHPGRARATGGVLLVASAACLALAPLVLPGDYDPLRHTTSEAAGQGVDGAWLARTGFVLFGAAVLLARPARGWQLARALHAVFGGSMVMVAVFASRSWRPADAFVAGEDVLHSVFASTMGFAFAGGVAAAAVATARARGRPPTLDVAAVVASVGLPLGMLALPTAAGALQRLLFAVAYCWYGRELLWPLTPPSCDR